MLVTLQTAKQYLRVDTSDEDELITGLIRSSEKYCREILRLTDDETLPDTPEVLVAVLYALAFLYEHRENGGHIEMMKNLRVMLGGDRKEVF